jgi:hypothetical protein
MFSEQIEKIKELIKRLERERGEDEKEGIERVERGREGYIF